MLTFSDKTSRLGLRLVHCSVDQRTQPQIHSLIRVSLTEITLSCYWMMKINLNSPQLSFCHLEQLWNRHHFDANSRVDSQLLHLLAQRIHTNNYILIRCLLHQQQTMLILNDEDFSLFFLSFRTTAMLTSSWWQYKSWSPCNYYNTWSNNSASNSELDTMDLGVCCTCKCAAKNLN